MTGDKVAIDVHRGPPRAAGVARLIYVDFAAGAAGVTRSLSLLSACWRRVLNYKWQVLLAGLVGLMLGGLWYLRQDPIYEARAVLELAQPGRADAPQAGTQTWIRILQSSMFRERVERRLAWKPQVEVRIVPGRRPGSIEILSESPDPQLAATYSNLLAQEYVEYERESKRSAADGAANNLAARLAEARVHMDDSEYRWEAFRRQSGLFEGADRSKLEEVKLGRIREELGRAEELRAARQIAYEMAAFETPAHRSKDKTKATRNRSEMDRLGRAFREADQRRQLLAAAFLRQSTLVMELSRKELASEGLSREARRKRAEYEDLLHKFEAAVMAAASAGNSPYAIGSAGVPGAPVSPSLARSLGIGTTAGSLLGALLALGAGRRSRARDDRWSRFEATGAHATRPEPEGRAGASPRPQYEAPRPSRFRPPPTEAIKEAVDSILVTESPSARKSKVVIVTSASRGEGKSEALGNLGIALAGAGQNVLLIDADLRKPGLHALFGTPNNTGLSDLPHDNAKIRSMQMDSLVKPTGTARLFLLPSGPGLVSMASLHRNNRMKELLDRSRREFDTILIDTPPLMYPSDTRILGRLCDRAILVVNQSLTTSDDVSAARRLLIEDGIDIVDTVVSQPAGDYPAPPPPSSPPGRLSKVAFT